MLMSAELKGCVTQFIYFLDLPWVRHNCAKFHRCCRICVTDFREVGLFARAPPPYPWAAPKNPILNKVKTNGMVSTKLIYHKEWSFASNYFIFLKSLFQFQKIKSWFDVSITQMLILVLSGGTGVLSDADFSLWVSLKQVPW